MNFREAAGGPGSVLSAGLCGASPAGDVLEIGADASRWCGRFAWAWIRKKAPAPSASAVKAIIAFFARGLMLFLETVA
jgi:hypothetical protein